MSKTAEDQIKNAAQAYTELQSLGTSNDYQAFIAGAYFASSSKDARIKELEEQVKFYEDEIPVNIEIRNQIKELELYEYTLSQARKHLQLKEGESIESKFDELEARLETAENMIQLALKDYEDYPQMRYSTKEKLKLFLTNKTE
jgi:aminopeptidase N